MEIILRKTEAGIQALQVRDGHAKLPARLRTLLLQVDGQKTYAQLDELANSLGNPVDILKKLAAMGLIEPIRPPKPEPSAREIAAAALATVAEVAATEANAEHASSASEITAEADPSQAVPSIESVVDEVNVAAGESLEDIPVSYLLPEALRPAAALMRRIADTHLGIGAILLKRRISRSDTEKELRMALLGLREALAKQTGTAQADNLLQEVYGYLPMIGLNRSKTF